MNRDKLTTIMEVSGAILISFGASLWSIPLSLIVGGVCLIMLGWANS
jgi:uncharacterized membrane protein AbrB (regulator of aidB expression)